MRTDVDAYVRTDQLEKLSKALSEGDETAALFHFRVLLLDAGLSSEPRPALTRNLYDRLTLLQAEHYPTTNEVLSDTGWKSFEEIDREYSN